jgi:hypothetical protein
LICSIAFETARPDFILGKLAGHGTSNDAEPTEHQGGWLNRRLLLYSLLMVQLWLRLMLPRSIAWQMRGILHEALID